MPLLHLLIKEYNFMHNRNIDDYHAFTFTIFCSYFYEDIKTFTLLCKQSHLGTIKSKHELK